MISKLSVSEECVLVVAKPFTLSLDSLVHFCTKALKFTVIEQCLLYTSNKLF